jgi:hypothetical protein
MKGMPVKDSLPEARKGGRGEGGRSRASTQARMRSGRTERGVREGNADLVDGHLRARLARESPNPAQESHVLQRAQGPPLRLKRRGGDTASTPNSRQRRGRLQGSGGRLWSQGTA